MLTMEPTAGPALQQARSASPLDILLVVLALGFAAMGLRPIIDPDAWWHLRTGDLIIHSGFTTTDPWSFASTRPWLLHEWGSEVLMYASYALGGYHGLMALHALAMLGLAGTLLRSIRRKADPVIAGLVGVIALYGTFLGTAERPQLVSWIFLAATVPALRSAVSAGRTPWWLIPVTWVWANMHGLWLVGPAILMFLVAGRALDLGLRHWRELAPSIFAGTLAVGVAALTPNGPALLLAPLHVRAYARFVGEWGPPSIMNPFFGASFVLLAVVLIGWAMSPTRPSFSDVALIVGTCLLALPYIRTLPMVAIVAAPMAAGILQAAVHRRPPKPFTTGRVDLGLAGAIVAMTVGTAIVWLPKVPTTERDAPVRASAFLDALPGRARVLNEYTEGGWLLWTARDTSPSIDGRTEIYDPAYISSLFAAERLGDGWQRFVANQRYDAAWLYRQTPLVFGLQSLGWTTAFQDKYTVVLLPPSR